MPIRSMRGVRKKLKSMQEFRLECHICQKITVTQRVSLDIPLPSLQKLPEISCLSPLDHRQPCRFRLETRDVSEASSESRRVFAAREPLAASDVRGIDADIGANRNPENSPKNTRKKKWLPGSFFHHVPACDDLGIIPFEPLASSPRREVKFATVGAGPKCCMLKNNDRSQEQ